MARFSMDLALYGTTGECTYEIDPASLEPGKKIKLQKKRAVQAMELNRIAHNQPFPR
jgi:hypothetical protein